MLSLFGHQGVEVVDEFLAGKTGFADEARGSMQVRHNILFD